MGGLTVPLGAGHVISHNGFQLILVRYFNSLSVVCLFRISILQAIRSNVLLLFTINTRFPRPRRNLQPVFTVFLVCFSLTC
jgi:hypothetical protein